MTARFAAPLIGLVAIAAFAVPPAFAPLKDPGVVPGLASPMGPVVSISEPLADGERRIIEGRVTKVLGPREFVSVVQVGQSKFEVGLPPRVRLPLRVGDDIRAELWTVGGKLHARVSDSKGHRSCS